MMCPSPLGTGVKTKREYCDVLTGRDPKEGIIIKLPPHRGPVTLRFNLHNRHTYSEEEVRMKRGFASYIAGIGVLTLDNTLLTRAAVATEFRRAEDLSSASPAAPARAASKRSRRSGSKRSRFSSPPS